VDCCAEVLTISSLEERACGVATLRYVTTVGEEGPFGGWRTARHVPGRNASQREC
jgi:hypothetical protein